MSTIYEFVKEERDNRRTDTVEITDGYEVNRYETLNTIELYQLPLHDRQLRAPG